MLVGYFHQVAMVTLALFLVFQMVDIVLQLMSKMPEKDVFAPPINGRMKSQELEVL